MVVPGSANLVLALSGRTAAGKSSISKILAEDFVWPLASFGGFVRAEAEDRGLPSDRGTLQWLGESLISELGWREFCLAVLASGGIDAPVPPCIVEGVRHLDTVASLRAIFAPARVVHVHLDVSDDVRAARLADRGINATEGEAWEMHSTERDVLNDLPSQADLLVQVDARSPGGAASLVERWVSEQGQADSGDG